MRYKIIYTLFILNVLKIKNMTILDVEGAVKRLGLLSHKGEVYGQNGVVEDAVFTGSEEMDIKEMIDGGFSLEEILEYIRLWG